MLLIKCLLDWFREDKKAKLKYIQKVLSIMRGLIPRFHRVVEVRVEVLLTHSRFNSTINFTSCA